MTIETATAADWLAVCYFGGFGAYGRGPTKDKAVDQCRKALERDFGDYDIGDRDLVLCLYDITGHDEVRWDDSQVVRPTDKPEVKIAVAEQVTIQVKQKRRRRN